MKTRTHGLNEKEMELVKLLMADCQTTGDIQAKLMCADLKKIYGAVNLEDAEYAKEEFRENVGMDL